MVLGGCREKAKPISAMWKLFLCIFQGSGRCSVFSSFLSSGLLFLPQLDVAVTVMEKSLHRLPKSEFHSEDEKKSMSQPFWCLQQVYPWQIFISGIQLILFALYGTCRTLLLRQFLWCWPKMGSSSQIQTPQDGCGFWSVWLYLSAETPVTTKGDLGHDSAT